MSIDKGTQVVNVKSGKIGIVRDWSDLETAAGQKSFAFSVEVDDQIEVWSSTETAPWQGKTHIIEPKKEPEPNPIPEKRGIIFISCGQYTPEEKAIGNRLLEMIDHHTQYSGYFAERQTNLRGLTDYIFNKLNECVGLVVVMHSRGEFKSPSKKLIVRASVWVEQEIAIASFLEQIFKRKIEVILYTQRGLTLEGVRKYIHLNPVEFSKSDEVLKDFEKKLGQGIFSNLQKIKSQESQKASKTQILEQFLKTKLFHIELLLSSSNVDPEVVEKIFYKLKNTIHIAFGDLELKKFLLSPGIEPQKGITNIWVSLTRMKEYLSKQVLGNFNATWLSKEFVVEELAPYEDPEMLVRSTGLNRGIYVITGRTKQRLFEADLIKNYGIFSVDDPRIPNVSSEELEKFQTE